MAILEARNLTKQFPTAHGLVTAVDDVNLEVHEGDFLCVMGPSGSGKSTLISLLGAIDRPTSGHVLLRDQNIAKFTERELLALRRFRIGFTFQAFYLLQHLTALENVLLPLSFQEDVDDSERHKRALQMLDEVGLGHRSAHYPRQLSGGEKQRVAIARALINSPELLLADEPTGNLDTEATEFILALFEKFNSEGQTIIVVTHDDVFTGYSNRLVEMQDGQLIRDS
jgi:putative ABC transport system ATP-binding protein